MKKQVKRICAGLLITLLFVLGNSTMLMAAETKEYLFTDSVEIRTDGTPGLRIISAIDEEYLNSLKETDSQVEYGTVLVPATVLEANAGQELEVDKTYKYNGKSYTAVTIPATQNWGTKDGKIYFTGVLTGINGSGFNTRYAARAYLTVDGVTTYGNTVKESCYSAAQKMASSEDVADSVKEYVTKNVIDTCDDSKKVTKDSLAITSANLTSGNYKVEGTSKVRNYKKVIIDESVQSGTITFDNIRVRELEISESASCTIQANGAIFDSISTVQSKTRSAAGTIVLNLGADSNTGALKVAGGNLTVDGNGRIARVAIEETANVTLGVKVESLQVAKAAQDSVLLLNGNVNKLSTAAGITVSGNARIEDIAVTDKVTGLTIGNQTGNLNVSKEAAGSSIKVNGTVDNAVLDGANLSITGDGKLETVENNGENNLENIATGEVILPNSIQSVKVQGTNRMIVTLERATETALKKEDMTILCHGGSDMTILDVQTTDRKVYNVTTSVFAKDDTYIFSIMLADGRVIQKDFSYRINFPMTSNVEVLRSETTRAEFNLYDVDEGGYVYIYIPGFTQVSQRSVLAQEDITVDLVKKGYKQEIKTGFNKVMISGLEEGISYDLYYVLEGYGEGRVSDVNGPVRINGTVQEDPNISKEYSITSVVESPSNTFTIKLNKAPEEILTLQNFSFICPADSAINLQAATLETSADRMTYVIKVPENYGHFDNEYTAKITFSDGTVAKQKFTVHFNPPRITNAEVKRVSDKKLKISFNSDEKGRYWAGTYTWDHNINVDKSNTPKADDVIAGNVDDAIGPFALKSGYTEFTWDIDNSNRNHKDFFMVFMDEAGNYGTTYHWSIPDEVDVPTESPVQIQSIEYLGKTWMGGPILKVTFDDYLDRRPGQSDIQFQAITGAMGGSKWTLGISGGTKEMTVEVLNMSFKSGTYKFIVNINYKGEAYTVEKEFMIP